MISLKSLLNEGAAITSDFMQKVMQWENNKAYKPGGWNDKKQRWFPHKSPEGGLPTIAYGHKLLLVMLAAIDLKVVYLIQMLKNF